MKTNRMKKRILSFLLVLCMVCSLMPMTVATAATPTTPITSVTVSGLEAPVAGQQPDFTATITTVPANAAEIVSVNWTDDFVDLGADDVFETGARYYVWLEIAPKAGYSFDFDSNDDYTGTSEIVDLNVDFAYLLNSETGSLYLDTPFLYAFSGSDIRSVEVTGLDAPVVGAHPDFTATLTTVPANAAQIVSVNWVDIYGDLMEADDVFESGNAYFAWFEILPKEGYTFPYYGSDYCGESAIRGFTVDLTGLNDPETGALYLDTTQLFTYDVSAYRSGSTYTYPNLSVYDLVFAGWYTDPTLTTPLGKNVTTGTAYAKYVDENVLSVKWQVSSGTNASSASTSLRVLTTVDDLRYAQVGFTVEAEGKSPKDLVSKTVYRTIYGYSDGTNAAYTPDIFSWDSNYFMAHTLTGIPQSDFNKTIRVTPKWTTLDGTVVSGIPLEIRISDGF